MKYKQIPKIDSIQELEQFLQALRRQDDFWSECFGEDFYQLHFSDLFTKMWQEDNRPVPRSMAYQFMAHLSILQAGANEHFRLFLARLIAADK